MNAVAKLPGRLPMPAGMTIPPEQWRVLTDAIFPSAKTPEAIVLALDYCRARKLDVFKRSIHIVPVWNRQLKREVETVWPGISELQVTAARTGQWAGMDAPEWGPILKRTFTKEDDRGDKTSVTVEYPEWCSVTVYRLIGGQKYAFCEPVYWIEAYARQGRSDWPNDMWQKRTRGQLHKNAKAAALRAAFPEEMGNDYTAEEMEGQEVESGGVIIEGKAELMSRPRDAVDADSIPALDAPQSDKQGDGAARLIARIEACATEDDLHAISGDQAIATWRGKLAKTRPELDTRIADAFGTRYEALTAAGHADAVDALPADDVPGDP